jgi:hypothetical protein
MRLKSIQIGFSFPEPWIKSANISKARLMFSAENIYTLTNYQGMDPDIGPYYSNILLRGVDWGNYPLPKSYTLGLNVSF